MRTPVRIGMGEEAQKVEQALRFYADEAVGYPYPESYDKFFGPDYTPPDYIRRMLNMPKIIPGI